MFHVNQIVKKLTNGCTEPYLAKISNETEEFYAVIKLQDNIHGVLTLINELISYNLAVALDVNMPQSGIARLDESTDFGDFKIEHSNYGYCFYSKYLGDRVTVLNHRLMKYISNKDAYEKIILFDHLVYNKDRNKGNLLICSDRDDKLLYAIDHTHVFKNQTIWDSICLNQGIKGNDYTDPFIMEYNGYDFFFRDKTISYESLLAQAQIFKEKINENLLTQIFDFLPSEWVISSKDLEALKKYLLYRAEKLEDMCLFISKYCDNKDRGYKNEK
jgi:hypothetical protein